jgi:hypothetical protein
MGSPVFVTAIYRIYGDERPEYCSEVWARFAFLARHLPAIHVFCSLADAARLADIPNVIPHFVEFMELDTYRTLADAHDLPDERNTIKDSKEFMILMNAKPEFLRRVQTTVPNASYYVWIDAGIQKILHYRPMEALTRMVTRCVALRTDKILIPGIEAPRQYGDVSELAQAVYWRICGGFCIVPATLVRILEEATMGVASDLLAQTGKLTWEVNIWGYLESRLPIRWYGCGWNESIFEFPAE